MLGVGPGLSTVTSTPGMSAATGLSLAGRVRQWLAGAPELAEPQVTIVVDPVEKLTARWRAHSEQHGWLAASDWWDPACDAVVEALLSGHSLEPALTRLGHARAELGCGIEETLDDLIALWRAHFGSDPTATAMRALASGWADAGMRPIGADSCIDPLTRLVSKAYLEARLSELYRDSRSRHPAELYCLIVVDVGEINSFSGLTTMGRVAEAMRRVCTNGETTARLARGRAVVICPNGPQLAEQLAELDALLNDENAEHASVWIEALPRTFPLCQGLLTDLSR